MGWLSRIFMNDTQRALLRPEDYTAKVDADAVREEIVARFRDPETRGYALRALDDHAAKPTGFSLADVVESRERLDDAVARNHDPSLHEVGICFRLGEIFLSDLLLARANRLAADIKPGAAELLSV